MGKTPNNSTQVKKSTKEVSIARNQDIPFLRSPWLNEYLDPSSLRITPVSEKIIDIIAQELLDWSCENENFTLTSFLVKKRIHWKTFCEWKEKFPKLKWAHDISMMAITDRREVGGLTRKLDPSTAFNSLAKYDPTWAEFMQWKSNLKQEDSGISKVVIEVSDLSRKQERIEG